MKTKPTIAMLSNSYPTLFAEPAIYDPPYWNRTQDKTKPYRYREIYVTMNDKYDTWDTQIKYRKQNMA